MASVAWRSLRGGLGAAVALVMGVTTSAWASDYYQGKQITVIVGVDAGSGYDIYARLLTRHMGKHIPGNPNFVVQNMPGAGSVTASQYLANIAAKDGTAIGSVFPGALVEPMTGEASKYRYQPTKFEYLGTMDSGTRLCFSLTDSGIRSIEDLRQRKAITAGTAAGSSTTDYAWFMNALAGTKFEVVTGYKGPGDVFLALERGEATAVCSLDSATINSLRPDWISTGRITLLMQAGLEPSPRIKAPSVWNFIKPEDKPVVELIVGQQFFGRPFLAPPGTPPQAVQILRKAFMDTLQDKALLAEAEKMKLDINPKSGEEVAALINKMYASPPDIIERMKKAVRP
jgi:tripartite-type tricarboxylate transporter receptor subunit TctC